MVASIASVVLLLSLCSGVATADGKLSVPSSAPDFSTYTEMEGVAFTSEVAGMNIGDRHIDYWNGAAYTFTVGVNVFATFEEAYSYSDQQVPNLFALAGEQGEIEISGSVKIYGYYYDINPNLSHRDAATCPSLNPMRDVNMETVFDNISIGADACGEIYIGGFTLSGCFYDAKRGISSVATDITLENIIVYQKSEASPNQTHLFVISNPNNQNIAASAADNKDSFTLRNSRMEKVLSLRISTNQIPPRYTVDGLVSVSGCTTFYGFLQWQRYMKNAVFTMTNCYFEDFAALDGRGFFIHMEGLNKFNGDCSINFANNVFGGDATDSYITVYTKLGYDVNITGNLFLGQSSGLKPLAWLIGYDTNIFPDAAENADVSDVDLSSIVEISKNRFVGYTNFSKIANSHTAFDLSDNFFTADTEGYKTALGKAPSYNAGWTLSGYWVDYALSVYSDEIPAISFDHASVQEAEGGFVLYSDSATVDLYDWGLILPNGIVASLTSGESLSEIKLKSGVNTRTLRVLSYDGTASQDYTLTIHYVATQLEAIRRLKEAYIRLNSGCYTEQSLAAYAKSVDALKNAIERNNKVQNALTNLNNAETKLVYHTNSPKIDIRYYELFTDLKNYVISDTEGWKKFAALVNDQIADFYGKTISISANLDFEGATIDPVGGCFETASSADKPVFYGTLDGGGHLIENFKIDKPESYGVGLFGRTLGATVKNLRVGQATIIGYDKVGGIAGFGDSSAFINCSSEADVSAVYGADGIAGVVSQARTVTNPYSKKSVATTLTNCINYGTITSPHGRACGVFAWGQTTATVVGCINYGDCIGDDMSYPIGRWGDAADFASLMSNCYYFKAAVPQGNAIHMEEDRSNEVAWQLGLSVSDERVAIKDCGAKVYRIALDCGAIGMRYYYGPAGAPVDIRIDGFHISEVRNGDQVVILDGMVYSADCNYTMTLIPYQYSVTYVLNGGTFVEKARDTFTAEKTFILPSGSIIEKDGYLFAGWYDRSDLYGKRRIVIDAGTTENVTVYAKYVKAEIEISSADELIALASDVNDGVNYAGKGIKITADIDLSGSSFSGIGKSAFTPFAGILDGGGHRITGMNVQGRTAAGFIGALSDLGSVRDLLVEGSVSGTVAGGIVGNNMGGAVENCSFNGSVTSSSTEIRLISQNVRYNSSSDLHDAADRHTPLKEILLAQNPDVIGFQEADSGWRDYLIEDFSDYNYIWKYRGQGTNTTTKGLEATPIFYKKSKFNLLDSGHFWLSDTPDQPSLCFNEDINRICSWVKLQVKTSGEVFFFFNTHFPLDDLSRVKSAAVMKAKVAKIAGDYHPYFMTADWNCGDPSNGYYAMTDWSVDLSQMAEIDATNGSPTFNGFKLTPSTLIDICFGRENTVKVPYYKVILDTYYDSEGRECPPSDHYGVYYEVELQSGAGGIVGNNEGVVHGCIASGSCEAESFCGSVCGKNLGVAESLYYGDSEPCGTQVGVEDCFSAENLNTGIYQLNERLGGHVWGVEDSQAVLLPRGEEIYLIQYLDPNGKVSKTDWNTLNAAKSWHPDYDTPEVSFTAWTYSISGTTAIFTPQMGEMFYTVRFLDRDGKEVKSQTLCAGESAAPPEMPALSGYTFMGWDEDYTLISADLTIRPIYLKTETFQLTLLSEGNFTTMTVNGESVASGATYTAESGTFYRMKAGDGFLYWKDESNRIVSENAVLNLNLTKHTTLTAVYETNRRYTVTFLDIDDVILQTQVVTRTVSTPQTPVRPGMTFVGWDRSYRGLTDDILIRATYTAAVNCVVNVVGGSASAESVPMGESVTFTADPKEQFAGWTLDGKNVFSTKPTLTLPIYTNLVLTALYTETAYRGVVLLTNGEGVVQLVRRVEGDYTVLGSGILYGDSSVVTLVRECVGKGGVQSQSDSSLTRNGSALFTVDSATYLRGYVVLLDEQTGETVVQYTDVIQI